MGLMITKLAKRIAALMDTMQDARILLVGLDGAGKTTLLYKFKIGEAGLAHLLPTLLFQACALLPSRDHNLRESKATGVKFPYYTRSDSCI